MEIGSRLKFARQNAKYTQEQAATELNVSRQTVSNWENNKTYPELSHVIQMSDMYKLSLDTLLRENADYISYINESTKPNKIKFHLSILIEIILFFVVWGAILFSYYYNLPIIQNWLDYSVLVYIFIFPPFIFTFSAVVGADPHWGRFKWILIPVFAYSVCFMDFCTFNSNSLFTNGDVFEGIAIEFLPFFVVSFIGMVVGVIINGTYNEIKAKRGKKNGTGNKA